MPTYKLTDKTGKTVPIEADQELSPQQLAEAAAELQRRGVLAVDRSLGQYALETLSNVPGSGLQIIKDTVTAVTNPVETVEGLAGIMLGAGQQLSAALGVDTGDEYKPYAGALAKHYKDRYGSVQAVQDSFREDPLGVLSEAMAVVLPVASGTKAVASVAGNAKLAGGAEKLASIANTTATALDPISLAVAGPRIVTDRAGRVKNAISTELFNFSKAYGFPEEIGTHNGKQGPLSDLYKEIVLRESIEPTKKGLEALMNKKNAAIRAQKQILDSRTGDFITRDEILKPIEQKIIALKRLEGRETDRAAKIRELNSVKNRIDSYFDEQGFVPDWEAFANAPLGSPFQMKAVPVKGNVLKLSDANALKQLLDTEAFGVKKDPNTAMAGRSIREFGADEKLAVSGTIRSAIEQKAPELKEVNSLLSDYMAIEPYIAKKAKVAEQASKITGPVMVAAGATIGAALAAMTGSDLLSPGTFGAAAGGSLTGALAFGGRQALTSQPIAGPIAMGSQQRKAAMPPKTGLTEQPYVSPARAAAMPMVREAAQIGQEQEAPMSMRISERIDRMMNEILGQ